MSLLEHKIDRSDSSHAILEASSRKRKAEKIIAVLSHAIDLKKAIILDIGTGSGHIAYELSKVAKDVTSTDITDERRIKKGYKFKVVQNEKLPFKPKTFDAVISNHVIEHVENQQQHIDEMHRVLVQNGVIYLATPNKFWLNDPHYKLPFISWVPKPIANFYLKTVSHKKWDIKPLSKAGIKKLAAKRFIIDDSFIDIVKNPTLYHLDTFKPIQPVIRRIPRQILSVIGFFIPTIIITMRKK